MKIHSVKYNYAMNMTLTLSGVLLPLITFPYATRVLGPDPIGEVSFVVSLVGYFTLLAQLGIPTYGQVECAKVRDDKEKLTQVVHELLVLNLILCVVCYAILAACTMFIPRLYADKDIIILVSAMILLTSVGMGWLYSALEQYDFITICSVGFRLAAMVFLFIAVKSPDDYMMYATYSIFGNVGCNVINVIHSRKFINLRHTQPLNIKRHMKPVLVFFAMALTTTIYTNLDTVMLGFLSDSTQLGYYYAATRIKTMLIAIVTSLGAVLLPRSSYYVEKGEMEKFQELTAKALQFVTILAASLTAYFVVFSSDTMLLLSGESFTGAIPAMALITPTVLLIAFTNIIGIQTFVPLGMQKYVIASTGTGAVIDVVLNILLMPKWGAAGGSAATLAAEFGVLLVQLYFFRKVPGDKFKRVSFIRIIPAIAVASACAYGLSLFIQGHLLTLVCTAVLFGIVVLLMLFLFKEPFTREYLRKAWLKVKPKGQDT